MKAPGETGVNSQTCVTGFVNFLCDVREAVLMMVMIMTMEIVAVNVFSWACNMEFAPHFRHQRRLRYESSGMPRDAH
jgi:hypothetical protein